MRRGRQNPFEALPFFKIFCLRVLDLFDNFSKTRQKLTSLMSLEEDFLWLGS
jgi:hypothetical protein